MIHKIKALYDNGEGLSIRAIAKELKLSRNTVRKYLQMDEKEITAHQEDTDRDKALDAYRDYIIHLLGEYPKLTAVKIQRKLKRKHPELGVSDRTVRRYVQALKQTTRQAQQRYYQPVLDMVPGVQCQVDPGELRGVSVGGIETTVYFVVFVLSYSRLMYVSASPRPINTSTLIQMHDAAFRYFGGMVEECVYDQTKMVVLSEQYRELEVNPRFNEYATHAGYRIQACEGYDPESKGKVEAGVKYVKQNGLYGETFDSWSHLESHLADWLDTMANQRIHGTTGVAPWALYREQEQLHMKPYLTPSVVHSGGQRVTRKADKTGLIAWRANKYSVPLRYQRAHVGVDQEGDVLCLYDLESGEEIARHAVAVGKGQVQKNRHHYRDLEEKVATLEHDILQLIGHDHGAALCALIKQSEPRYYKDQLSGVKGLLQQHGPLCDALFERLITRPRLTAKGVRDYLEAYSGSPPEATPEAKTVADPALLQRYQAISMEVPHDLH